MSTPLRVSLYHGAWQRNDEGYWIFQRKPSDLGYTVLVKPKESFEELETIIRDRYKLKPETPLAMAYHPPEWMLEPDGTRRLPITVSTTSEFLNKTAFTVGGATFVFNGYNDRELVASKDVLEEIFTEHEMVSINRAHLEITNARHNQQENAAESSVSSSQLTKEASGSSPSLPRE
ncbi:BnaC09g21320D [Brassica napus]|uniref:BnaC09g21320D protein n=1 Tax=Brassica napus TaxID=3708 RepID=A0A078I8X1_BRANA|nr:BnaC09g21320D [Brassica napus]